MMAEAAADSIAERLGVDEPSQTAEKPLYASEDPQQLDELVAEFDIDGPSDADVIGSVQ